ncbi:MAG: GFA family protein [Burkholderiales bacterium]
MSDTLTGSCLCGAIRYAIDAPVTELRACHCVHCQKASGAGGSVNAVVPSAAFRILRGEPKVYGSQAESGRTLNRHFCGDCGSPLYSQRANNKEFVVVRIGTLDSAPPMKVTSNIWTRSARPWAFIDPASKRFPGQPDAPAAK